MRASVPLPTGWDVLLRAVETERPGPVRKVVQRLTLLAPDIVEAILDGRQGEGMTLPGLMVGVAVEWEGPTKRGE